MEDNKIPQLVAHRGYMKRYPENSWLGLKAAIDCGACWLEFDVQMCSDGTYILLHDASLKRTAGVEKTVFELDTKSLNNISIHEQERFDSKYYPLPLSTLDTVLRKLKQYPQIRFMVEIKEESLEYWGIPKVMDGLLEKLEPFYDNCVLISFSHNALEYTRSNSDLDIGWVIGKYNNDSKSIAQDLMPEYLVCNQKKLPDRELPWSGPWQWMLYSITLPKEAIGWGRLGIELIETSDIGALLQNDTLLQNACYHGI